MSQNRGIRGKRTSNYEFIYITYETQPFNIDEYVQNPAMIRKLHEEKKAAYSASTDLRKLLETSTLDNHKMELQKQELDLKLGEAYKMIEKLQLEKEFVSTELKDVRVQLEEMKRYNHELEFQRHELDFKLNDTKQKLFEANQTSLPKYVASTAAAIVLGFGVNVVTSAPSDWKGWVIIGSSVILGVVAFFIPRKGS